MIVGESVFWHDEYAKFYLRFPPTRNEALWRNAMRNSWASSSCGFGKGTVDGRNPAPVSYGKTSHYLQGFYTCQVVQDFFHQQYLKPQFMAIFGLSTTGFPLRLAIKNLYLWWGVGLTSHWSSWKILWKGLGWDTLFLPKYESLR